MFHVIGIQKHIQHTITRCCNNLSHWPFFWFSIYTRVSYFSEIMPSASNIKCQCNASVPQLSPLTAHYDLVFLNSWIAETMPELVAMFFTSRISETFTNCLTADVIHLNKIMLTICSQRLFYWFVKTPNSVGASLQSYLIIS